MSRFHLTSTSRALYRVFVAPNLPPPSSTLSRNASISTPPTFLLPLLPKTSIRHKHFKKDTQRHALSDYYTYDNMITASHINLVDSTGTFRANIPLIEAMSRSSINRVTHHLVQMSDGKVDEFGVSDPDHLPTCKIVSKMELRAQHQKKVDIARRASKGLSGTGPTPKNLELNWAIAGGDLKHRLEKLKDFLKEGRKVEVLIGPKRRGKKATDAECKNVLDAIKEAVLDCKGASEAKEPEGAMGGVMTLIYEGRILEEKAPETSKVEVKSHRLRKALERKAEEEGKAQENSEEKEQTVAT